jgi:glycosyltransferase involved in cell wall biosynthesis
MQSFHRSDLVARVDCKILAVLSDVNSSPQLLKILEDARREIGEIRVVIFGNRTLEIAKNLEEMKFDVQYLKIKSKWISLAYIVLIGIKIFILRPNIVFASGQYASIIGMMSARLLLVHKRFHIRHHSNLHHKDGMWFAKLTDYVTNKNSSIIIAVSTVVEQILLTEENVDPEKVILIPNGIELQRFKEITKDKIVGHKELKESKNYFNIGVVARLTDWKGVKYTAEAFVRLQQEFPNSRLHIVGSFSDSYKDIVDILSRANTETYSIQKEVRNVAEFMKSLDVFVHVPIGPAEEAFGIVYVEALAAGIPCIFTLSGVLHQLPKSQLYVSLVEYQDSEQIYESLVSLCINTGTSKRKIPKDWLNQFSIDVMSEKYLELMRRNSENNG